MVRYCPYHIFGVSEALLDGSTENASLVNYLQRRQSTCGGGYQGRVIDYGYHEYMVSAKNYEE
jgi:hypothetical protein